MAEDITLEQIENAHSLIRKHLLNTPLLHSKELSDATGNDVYLKLESLQRTHAFKVRGALNKLANLSRSERERGVIAASSGNHALGVAYSAALLGVNAVVVMPVNAPDTKVRLARTYGASVVLHGRTYDQALVYARDLANQQRKALVPSFDDPLVIAGQGTIALEVLGALPDPDLFLAPIGGGGLVSGLAIALSAMGHEARVVGVQASGAASMLESVRAGRRIKLPRIQTIADGIAVQEPGVLTFTLVSRLVSEILTVSDADIRAAMVRVLREVGVVIEPAAAAPVAALLFDKALCGRGWKVCCVITGANVSQELLRQIVQGENPPTNEERPSC